LASDCFLASASFAGFGAAARWPLSAIKDANARASGRVGKFLDAGITILFPSGPRTWAGTGLDAAWRKKLVGGFPPSPFTNREPVTTRQHPAVRPRQKRGSGGRGIADNGRGGLSFCSSWRAAGSVRLSGNGSATAIGHRANARAVRFKCAKPGSRAFIPPAEAISMSVR
jgi:hypothetical protein